MPTKKPGAKSRDVTSKSRTNRKKATGTKKTPAKSNAETLKSVRKFRTLGQKRVGILFSGGPAPGGNAVISTASIQFLNDGYEVMGFYKGYQYLQNFDREKPKNFIEGVHYKSLGYDDITKIRSEGGSILRTSRANPCKLKNREIKNISDLANRKLNVKLQRVMDALEYLGISALISIGGDDTLKTAYYLSLLGVPVVHVPKTIDNDYFGIPWTFGFFSAIERAHQDIKVYNNEVRTTECYFVLELMGRKTGWYTLGAGIAGEAVRMIGPEEIGDRIDIEKEANRLVDLVLKREELNKPYGVILVSEGLVDKLPENLKPKSTDQHGNIVLAEAKIGEHLAHALKKSYRKRTGGKLTVKTGNIGYTTRCIQPSAFDVLLGSQLGMGAFQFVQKNKFSSMVSVGDNLEIRRVPFTRLIDSKTFKTKLRYVPLDGDFFKLAKSLEFRAVERESGL